MKYAFVRFKETKYEYIYICANEKIEAGNVVLAPVNGYRERRVALVMRVAELDDGELPIPKSRILRLEEILSERDRDCMFDDIGFMKLNTDEKLLEEWRFTGRNDWCEFYASDFGGEVSYQKDMVLTAELYDRDGENCFYEYTLTAENDLEIKIKFVQSILSQLYYGGINKEQFMEMFERIN